jgi:hypothetical protein
MNKQWLNSTRTTLLFILSASVFFITCSKKTTDSIGTEEVLSAKFFSQTSINDNDIQNIAKQIKQKNEDEHFLSSFIQNKGYILWNDVEKIKSSNGVLAILPFAFEKNEEVNGFVVARQDFQLSTTTFNVFTKKDLAQYGFAESSDKLNAQKVQSLINYFNYKIFNTSTYQLEDIRLLPDSIRSNYPHLLDKTKLLGKYKIKSLRNGTLSTNSIGSNTALFDLAGCFGYTEETEWWWNPDGDPCNCSGDEVYAYSTYSIVTVCFDGGGGGGGFVGSGSSGSTQTPPSNGGGGNLIPTYQDYAIAPFTWTYVNDDGSTFNDNYPNTNPDFQFDPNDNYGNLYPNFTNLVKNLKTFVKNSPEVLNALQKWSGFSKQQILDKLTFGHGPIIKVEEMSGRFGFYNKNTSENTLHMRASYVRGLEQSQLASTKQATAFLLAVTILHEFVHYGTGLNNISEGQYDFGLGFERDAFNVIVDDDNAGDVVVKFSKYF